jgi:large subunit ribosomal protein L28
MSRKDDITGKGALTGNTRSYAKNHSRRKWNLNLQKVKVKNGKSSTRTIKVSAKTLKTLKKNNLVV